MPNFPLYPKNPERICWGCEKRCPADDLCCGNGTIRTPHPIELFGDDWFDWLNEREHSANSGAGNSESRTNQSERVSAAR